MVVMRRSDSPICVPFEGSRGGLIWKMRHLSDTPGDLDARVEVRHPAVSPAELFNAEWPRTSSVWPSITDLIVADTRAPALAPASLSTDLAPSPARPRDGIRLAHWPGGSTRSDDRR